MNIKIDKNSLALRIKSLDGLTADEKSALIGLLNSRKKYGLVWEEKEEAVEELLREKLPVLTEVVEKRIVAKGSDNAPDHILIEGDNLHALTALQYTHAGMVDVIEIDPPYNTGNKDFVYNDSYVDKDDSFRHSKWLCFMSKRLRLAKILLKSFTPKTGHFDAAQCPALKNPAVKFMYSPLVIMPTTKNSRASSTKSNSAPFPKQFTGLTKRCFLK